MLGGEALVPHEWLAQCCAGYLKAPFYTHLTAPPDDFCNLHRAADELNMTQPGASRLIKDLEQMPGVRLFSRRSRRCW